MPHSMHAAVLAFQMGPAPTGVPRTDPLVTLFGSALGAFLTTFVVGGLLVVLAPEYTERMTGRVREEPIESLLYGVAFVLAVVLVLIILVVTIVGILAAIPLALLAYVVWAIGAAVAYLAIGDAVVGRGDGWLKPLLLGAALAGALTVTGIGGLVAFGIGAAGFGAVLRDWLDRRG